MPNDPDADGPRRAALDRHPTPGPRNSLWSWPDAKSPAVVVRNYLAILLARVSPSLRLKNWLFRRLGMEVGRGVAWGLESTPDVFWPERITVADDAIIGYDATLLCHEFLQDEYRLGRIRIGEGAMIGAGAVILPGVTVGAGARVAANSLVSEDVPPETTVAGVPADVVSTAGARDAGPGANRHAGDSDPDHSPDGDWDTDESPPDTRPGQEPDDTGLDRR